MEEPYDAEQNIVALDTTDQTKQRDTQNQQADKDDDASNCVEIWYRNECVQMTSQGETTSGNQQNARQQENAVNDHEDHLNDPLRSHFLGGEEMNNNTGTKRRTRNQPRSVDRDEI